jgi:hypothetical protein
MINNSLCIHNNPNYKKQKAEEFGRYKLKESKRVYKLI